MREDAASKAARYRREANKYGELAKQAEPGYLAAVFRKVAMQYAYMAEEVLRDPVLCERPVVRNGGSVKLIPKKWIEGVHFRFPDKSPREQRGDALSGPLHETETAGFIDRDRAPATALEVIRQPPLEPAHSAGALLFHGGNTAVDLPHCCEEDLRTTLD
jgi:hypothetical protein